MKIIDCDHHLAQWVAVSENNDQFYRLYCAMCGESLRSETYAPGTMEIFKHPVQSLDAPPALGVSVQDHTKTSDRLA